MTKLWRRPAVPDAPEPVRAPPPPSGSGAFPPDTDPEDSERLLRLREIIDMEIGWRSPEDEEAGDYEARLRQVAVELRQLRDIRARLRLVLGKVDEVLGESGGVDG